MIYKPNGSVWWAKTHGFLPTAEICNGSIRVYFAGRDDCRVGRIGYIDLDIDNPKRILYLSEKPILDIGEIGTFDDNGLTPSCVISVGEEKYLYYIGWQLGIRAPHSLFTGLAISRNGGKSYKKYSRIPILDRTNEEPFSRSAPFVMYEDEIYKMWYWTNEGWEYEKGCMHYNNIIKYIESDDGINWPACGHTCIVPTGEDYAVGRPWVIKENGIYKMWYSTRSRSGVRYRIDYAESKDGLTWTIKNEKASISVSENGWDSEVICFASVICAKNKTYMFYNGNRHGIDGFGYAELEEEA